MNKMANIKNVAGKAKDILVGNNIKLEKQNLEGARQAFKNTLRVNKPSVEKYKKMLERAKAEANKEDIAYAQKHLKHLDNYNARATENYWNAKKKLSRERMKTYGARTGVGALAVAPGYGIYKYKKNKRNKGSKDENEDEGARKAAKIGGNIGALGLGTYKALKAGSNPLDTFMYSLGGAAVGAGVGKGVHSVASKLKAKKNKEKTAYDIVVDAFEKIAVEQDKKKKQKPILLSDGAKKGALIGAGVGAMSTLSGVKEGLVTVPEALVIGGTSGALSGALTGIGVNAIRSSDRSAKERYERENR